VSSSIKYETGTYVQEKSMEYFTWPTWYENSIESFYTESHKISDRISVPFSPENSMGYKNGTPLLQDRPFRTNNISILEHFSLQSYRSHNLSSKKNPQAAD